jgi:hypothetical protein
VSTTSIPIPRGRGVTAVVLAAPGAAAAYVSGRELAGVVSLPEPALWAAAAGVAGATGAAVAAARISRWWRERGHLAVDIPDDELDAAALALLERIRAERRTRGEVV